MACNSPDVISKIRSSEAINNGGITVFVNRTAIHSSSGGSIDITQVEANLTDRFDDGRSWECPADSGDVETSGSNNWYGGWY